MSSQIGEAKVEREDRVASSIEKVSLQVASIQLATSQWSTIYNKAICIGYDLFPDQSIMEDLLDYHANQCSCPDSWKLQSS
jgi:hypothetical protein